MWCTWKEHNIHTFEVGEIEGSASCLLCWQLALCLIGLGFGDSHLLNHS